MFKILSGDKIEECLEFLTDKIAGAGLYTRVKAYGCGRSDAVFWYYEKNGEIHAFCGLLDGEFTFCGDKYCDINEIRLFSKAVGARSFNEFNPKYILKFNDSEKEFNRARDVNQENLKKIFPVIFEEWENADRFYERWYVDASLKFRRGLIHGKYIEIDGKAVSAALTSGETPKLSVISSVATLKDYRRNGFGEECAADLARSLDNSVFLATNNEKTAKWYERAGFVLKK